MTKPDDNTYLLEVQRLFQGIPTDQGLESICMPGDIEKEPERIVFNVYRLPEEVKRVKQKGDELVKKGQFDQAEKCYEEAIEILGNVKEIHPIHLSRLYSQLSICKNQLGKSRECIEVATEAIRLQPYFVEPLLQRAKAYDAVEKPVDAIKDYKKILYITQLEETGKAKAAEEGYNRCKIVLKVFYGKDWRITLGKELQQPVQRSEIPIINEIDEYYPRKQESKAVVQNIEQKISMKANNTISDRQDPSVNLLMTDEDKYKRWKNKGNRFVKDGEYMKAITYYTRCIDLFPNKETVIYESRALAYLRLNDASRAIEDTSQALKINPRSAQAFYRRAKGYKMLSQYHKCLESLDELLKVDPQHNEAKKMFFEVSQQQKQDIKEAKKSVRITELKEIKDGQDVLEMIINRTIPDIRQYFHMQEGEKDWTNYTIRGFLGELEKGFTEIIQRNGLNIDYNGTRKLRSTLGDKIVEQEIVNICRQIFRAKGSNLIIGKKLKVEDTECLHRAIYIQYRASEYSHKVRAELCNSGFLDGHSDWLNCWFKIPHSKGQLDMYRESILPAILGTPYNCSRDWGENRIKLRGMDWMKTAEFFKIQSPKTDIKLMATFLYAYLTSGEQSEISEDLVKYLIFLLDSAKSTEERTFTSLYASQEYVRWHIYELIQGIWQLADNENNKNIFENSKIKEILFQLILNANTEHELKFALYGYWKLISVYTSGKVEKNQREIQIFANLETYNNKEIRLAQLGILHILDPDIDYAYKPQRQRNNSPDYSVSSYQLLGEDN